MRFDSMNQAKHGSGRTHIESADQRQALDKLVLQAQQALRGGKPVAEALSESELDALRARYSRFEDERDENGYLVGSSHLVTKVDTPRPYLHLIGNNHSREYGFYASFWDQSGGGFSCLDSVLAGAVTSHKDVSYVPTIPRSTDHRHFYLREEPADRNGNTDIWHVFPQRGREEEAYDRYSCRQGLGSVRIFSERNRVAVELLVFVPVDDPLVNHGQLCVKGRFCITEMVNGYKRLKKPYKSFNGTDVEISWEEAIDITAKKLKSCPRNYGCDHILHLVV